ncbi:MAG: hypothetical protein EXS15_08015 [Phycisphaerales bacterium]|nr:hypothetical protein [Phycisphaerales bacterium]
MLAPQPSQSSDPCPACGYDLRAAPTTICPECGTPIEPRTLSTAGESCDTETITTAIEQLANGIKWTLIIWLGCFTLPLVGPLAWILLTISAGVRILALRRIIASGIGRTLSPPFPLALWPRLAWAELVVAVLGSALTVIASSVDVPGAFTALLLILRIGWIGLVAINNAHALSFSVALAKGTPSDSGARMFQFALTATVAAPILMLPFFLLEIVGAFTAGIPPWVTWSVRAVTVAGLFAGVGSVVLIARAISCGLDAAAHAVQPTRRDESVRIRRRPPAVIPDAPPLAGEGDVIPFAEDPVDPSA